ncbi:MAG TPA: O-antigen ligase family protein [Gemmataceae bacterium]|nr:O-antigen ligase family protein [Gemmataceae bacterium]
MNAAVALPSPARPAADKLRAQQTAAASRHALGFFLFLLLNAVLFVRAGEIVPGAEGWHIYEVLILACFAVSFPAVLAQFTAKSLEERPVTVCVLGLSLAVGLSYLAQLDLAQLADSGLLFLKIVVYYVLFVGLVDSPARLRTFLFWMAAFAAVTVGLAVLQFHDVITLPNLDQIQDTLRDAAGRESHIKRLTGSGIFHDPNELGVLIAFCFVLALYWLTDRRSGLARALWIGPLILFLYAMYLTQSRGALLAMGAGLAVFLVLRFGWRLALLASLFLAPAAVLLLSTRMTDISTENGTGQERIQAWSDGIVLMREAPLFGVGMGTFQQRVGIVAHNSYLQCMVELGVFGGVLFAGAFYLAAAQLLRLGDRRKHAFSAAETARLYPYLFGAFASYAVGMISLTLSYVIPTYTVLALATVFVRTAPVAPPLPATRFDLRLLGRMVGVAVVGFAGLYLFVRFFVVH